MCQHVHLNMLKREAFTIRIKYHVLAQTHKKMYLISRTRDFGNCASTFECVTHHRGNQHRSMWAKETPRGTHFYTTRTHFYMCVINKVVFILCRQCDICAFGFNSNFNRNSFLTHTLYHKESLRMNDLLSLSNYNYELETQQYSAFSSWGVYRKSCLPGSSSATWRHLSTPFSYYFS